MNNIFSLFTGSTPGVFSGKVVAFTGTLQSGNRKMLRSEAQRIVTERGGHAVTGEYGKLRNANLLVLGTQAAGRTKSQKMDAAADRNIPTITAEQFFRIYRVDCIGLTVFRLSSKKPSFHPPQYPPGGRVPTLRAHQSAIAALYLVNTDFIGKGGFSSTIGKPPHRYNLGLVRTAFAVVFGIDYSLPNAGGKMLIVGLG